MELFSNSRMTGSLRGRLKCKSCSPITRTTSDVNYQRTDEERVSDHTLDVESAFPPEPEEPEKLSSKFNVSDKQHPIQVTFGIPF